MAKAALFACLLACVLVQTCARKLPSSSGADQRIESSLFTKPGRMVKVRHGSRLSTYCVGNGSPTILLETGFGGGTAATWQELQPRLAHLTRTCSYDRAGYGFSTLGKNLPRDLNHMVADLAAVLARSGETTPYVLVGHSNGGHVISAYARLYPKDVAGLVFLDAAVALPEDLRNASQKPGPLDPQLQEHLQQIRSCLARSEQGLVPKGGDPCVDPAWYSGFSPALARAEIANRTKPDFWRAYLSEAENNYNDVSARQSRRLLPHNWKHLPIRVFIASVGAMSDEDVGKAFRLNPHDKAALSRARASRARWEQRQASLCSLAPDCLVDRVPTANHLVHNAALDQVSGALADLVSRVRKRQHVH